MQTLQRPGTLERSKVDFHKDHGNQGFSLWGSEWLPLIIFMLAVILYPVSGYGAEVLATTDRNPVALNESFQLTFTATQSPDDDPDFSPLEQAFDILNRSQSSNISLINGNVTRSIIWTLTLIARGEGRHTIPSIAFGSDKSSPISIWVKSAASNNTAQVDRGLFIEAEVIPQDPYVQSQAIYTVRIFQNVEIIQASLSDPQLDNAVIEKLGKDRNYYTQRGGNKYTVIERKFAIFPQQHGEQTLAPLELTADVVDSATSNSRFRGFFRRQSTKTMRAHSKPITLKVKPIPAEFKGQHWLPAQKLHVEQKWSNEPLRIQAGEPITRTLQITAQGTSVGQLPEFGSLENELAHIRYYPDQPTLKEKKEHDSIIAFREEKTALIPDQPGNYTLPAMEIPWWNTLNDQMETTILPETTITVLPAVGRTTKPNNENRAKELEPRPIDITRQKEETTIIAPPADGEERIWRWISLILAVGWLGTLFFISFRNKKTKDKNPQVTGVPDEKQARRAVNNACSHNDPVNTRATLLQWAKAYWKNSSPSSLEAISRRTGGDLATEIARLNQALYSPDKSEWKGKALWQALQRLEQTNKVAPADKNIGLEQLYKA